MSPHTYNRSQRNLLLEQLGADSRAVLRDESGRIAIDNAASAGQHAFQAMLATFLLSTTQSPHVLQAPIGAAMSSTSAYVNTVISHPDRLAIHTNTACRVASRFLPLITDAHGLHGIPGLRFDGIGKQRLRFVHLPTGGRLDLVDSHPSLTRRRRDFLRFFRRTTRWHHEPGYAPLWELAELHPSEVLAQPHWRTKPCMLLRSALMSRAVLLWGELDIRPSWTEQSRLHLPELAWETRNERPGAHQVATVLTATPARIPGAGYEPLDATSGLLSLAGATIWLRAR
ncbi:hypothetical protein ACIREE_40805 [Streptomyces sp. NPDC102467]|uniref:hypothetical protein n=1 Tax=Streptomyces sp. NPDC102467 TaxID=3366179 RepID=UPI00382576D7